MWNYIYILYMQQQNLCQDQSHCTWGESKKKGGSSSLLCWLHMRSANGHSLLSITDRSLMSIMLAAKGLQSQSHVFTPGSSHLVTACIHAGEKGSTSSIDIFVVVLSDLHFPLLRTCAEILTDCTLEHQLGNQDSIYVFMTALLKVNRCSHIGVYRSS